MEWEAFTVGMLNECEEDGGEYIGYKFLFKMLCSNQYEGVNLDILNALFPKLGTIKLCRLSHIDLGFLEAILKQVQYGKSAHNLDAMHQCKCKLCNAYRSRFKEIGFHMFSMNHPAFGTFMSCMKRIAE
eukprot:319899_1